MQTLIPVPVLETERLILRAHRQSDFDASVAMWADPRVTRYLRDKPFTEEESWTRFLRYLGHWALLGFGYWAAEEKASGAFIGELGFADYKREISPSLKGIPEIGWVLAAHAHGKGYASEAALAVTAWGDAKFGSAQTACIIDPENAASVRVAEKCGYRYSTSTTYHGMPTVMMFRERELRADSGELFPGIDR
jgi:RimJ/RimL family protein N-acetyltransferase